MGQVMGESIAFSVRDPEFDSPMRSQILVSNFFPFCVALKL